MHILCKYCECKAAYMILVSIAFERTLNNDGEIYFSLLGLKVAGVYVNFFKNETNRKEKYGFLIPSRSLNFR